MRSRIVVLTGMAVLVLALVPERSFSGEKIVGYYAAWKSGILPCNEIEYSNLTDIIIAFAVPDSDGTLSCYPGIPFPQLVDSAHAHGINVLLSIGGAGGGTYFPNVTADSASRAVFIKNIVSFLTTNHYDGIDIDWESPANTQLTNQLTALVREMRLRFDQLDTNWLITMAIPAGPYWGDHFDYEAMTQYISWYNLMCYDFVGSWSKYSGHNSPLYMSSSDPNAAGADSNSFLYMTATRKVPAAKLMLGVPFYAVEFDVPGLYEKLTNASTTNPVYSDIVSDIDSGWTYNWDDVSKVPYLTNSNPGKFITFEDTTSIRLKAEFVKRKALGGMMIWELSQDVYRGSQPLLETLASSLRVPTAVKEAAPIASGYKLFDNYPNPFNPSTTIRFVVRTSGFVSIKVYDVLGRLMKTLVDSRQAAGEHAVVFDGSGLASGVYFCRLTAPGFIQVKKVMLLK